MEDFNFCGAIPSVQCRDREFKSPFLHDIYKFFQSTYILPLLRRKFPVESKLSLQMCMGHKVGYSGNETGLSQTLNRVVYEVKQGLLKFKIFLSFCPIKSFFFLKIGTLRAKGIRKMSPLQKQQGPPCPSQTAGNQGSFNLYKSAVSQSRGNICLQDNTRRF